MSHSIVALLAVLLATLNFARPWYGRASPETAVEWVGRWLFGYGVLATIPYVWLETEAAQRVWRVAMVAWMTGMVLLMLTCWLRGRARGPVQ
jgi:hypothetical protein